MQWQSQFPKMLALLGLALAVSFPKTIAQRSEIGLANYYADYLQGRATAYGETYDRAQLTCAHRTHQPGTLLKVTRMDNGRSVVVRVNDRGPFTEGYVVSLSLAGAMALGLDQVGKARVQVDVVGHSNTPTTVANYASIPAPAEYNTYTAKSPQVSNPERALAQKVGQANPAMPTSRDLLPKTGNYSAQTKAPAEYSTVPPASYNKPADPYAYTPPPSYSAVPPASAAPSAYNYPQSTPAAPQEYSYANVPAGMTAKGLPGPSSATAPQSYNYYTPPAAASGPAVPQSYGYTPPARTTAAMPQSYASNTPAKSGIIKVKPGVGGYGVQIASYSNLENAERQAQAMNNQGIQTVYIMEVAGSGNARMYRVYAGNFSERIEAETYLAQIRSQYLLSGFVARM